LSESLENLGFVTAVMQDPFEGIGKPEPLKCMDADIGHGESI
jgi:Txe/YoeB family toxin of Txe-Axe toxin-antitoxin module